MQQERTKKIAELLLLLVGAIILTILLSITLGVSIYAVGVIVLILFFVFGTGLWRWKQGDRQVEDVIDTPETKRVLVITDNFDSLGFKGWKCLGSVYGESIVATHMVNDLWSNAKILIGGEPKSYQKVMNLSRRAAVNRMKISALKMGAEVISQHRLATPQVANMSGEVISYGTAWAPPKFKYLFTEDK